MKVRLFDPPLMVYEACAVQAELGEPVRTEGEEDLLGPHHRAVGHLDTCFDPFLCQRHLISVRVPRGGRLLM